MNKLSWLVLFLLVLVAFSASSALESKDIQSATNQLLSNYPQVNFYNKESGISRIYGAPFGGGTSPEDAAEQFRLNYAPVLHVAPDELVPDNSIPKTGNTQGVMFDQETGQYKFTMIYYSQRKDGIPVYWAGLRILVRNEPGYPIVWAGSTLKDLNEYQTDQSKASVNPRSAQNAFKARNPQYVSVSEPMTVIWAGLDNQKSIPTVGVEFDANDGQEHSTNDYRFIVNPVSGEIIYQQSHIIMTNVTGTVNGNATENFKSEQCGNEVSTHLPYATVSIEGGNSAYADTLGNFTITNSGSSAVWVKSKIAGHYFTVNNLAGSNDSLRLNVTPPGPANFLHNSANTSEYNRAEVNAYVHTNIVRDYTLRYNPTYPTVYTETSFPVYVNSNDGTICPGNAWYDDVARTLNFCRAGSDGTYSYPNTAFSTVVHHEYGHHLVDMAGSGQQAYGEGTGDVMGLLITDDPGAAYGFYGPCSTPLRNANNTIQYPCSGEIHTCGQLISGCVWSTRNYLLATNPTTYRNIISNLAINAILLHAGQSDIAPDITIDYLTLDDDDGNLNNGTPHHSEICSGFGDHSMTCPALSLLSFTYPNGKPSFVDPAGGTTMRVVVGALGASPQPGTGQLHYNAGSGWLVSNMTQISPNTYNAAFPAYTCGTTINYYVSAQTTTSVVVTDPSTAPSSYYSTVSGTGITTIFSDDFSTTLGWTGLGSSGGEWTIGVATGGTGGSGAGDPATDHSATSDNRLLGTDLVGGSTHGNYSNNLNPTYWVTSPVINCTGRTGITLSFWRWLGVEDSIYDHAYFQVYNGSSWVTLFANSPTVTDESAWSQWTYNISAYANNRSNFQFRFGIGTTDVSVTYCGWNIDDILITSVACDTVANGTIAGTVTDSQGAVNAATVHAVSGSNSRYDTTASNGAYSMSGPPGTYSVTFTQIDHRDTTATGIAVTSGNTTTLNMVMRRLPGVVKGTVTSAPSTPLANVRVIAIGYGKEDSTGSNGAYIIPGLVDGTYNLSFSLAGYRDTTLTGVAITPGDTTTRDVRMSQIPGYIIGIVRDSTGAPLQNIFVRINLPLPYITGDKNIGSPAKNLSQASGRNDIRDLPLITAVDSMYTNADGYYRSQLIVGNWDVRFTHPLYRDTTLHSYVVSAESTTVSPVLQRRNHPPVITSGATATATEDILFSYIATASDSDGVIPMIAINNYPVWMSVVGDTISGTPLEGTPSTSFRIIASDGQLADTQLVIVTVIPVNDPPVITSPASDTATEHILFTYHATATDPDGTPTISFIHYPSWLTPSGANISGTPNEIWQDTSFTVIASDGILADTQIVALTVIEINDPPVITSPAVGTAVEGEQFSYLAVAHDPEGVTLLVTFIDYPSWMTVTDLNIGGIAPMEQSDTSFTVIASDGFLGDTLAVTVHIVPANQAPVITSPAAVSATEDIFFSYTATATDPDGGTPQINFSHYPNWMSVNGSIISGTPTEGRGDTSFTVIASDGTLADTQLVSVHVIAVNDRPTILSPSTAAATVGDPFGYNASASDPDNSVLYISFVHYPSWLTPTDSTIVGTPPSGATDTSFMVIASDGNSSDSLLVSVTVEMAGCVYTPGDVNGTGAANGIDVTFSVGFFKGGALPPDDCGYPVGPCPQPSPFYAPIDVNGNCVVNGIDVTYFVGFLKGMQPELLFCPTCPPAGIVLRTHNNHLGETSK
jgi:hypothetical protein